MDTGLSGAAGTDRSVMRKRWYELAGVGTMERHKAFDVGASKGESDADSRQATGICWLAKRHFYVIGSGRPAPFII